EKFSALAAHRLGDYLRERTNPGERILVFGFTGIAYVTADRQSASRFFWSRPVVFGFDADVPGYGPQGLLDDLKANDPRAVVLERRDEGMDALDSATYFKSQPALRGWLESNYRQTGTLEDYEIWERS
ncbi:MAG: hypothetical protein ACRD1T_05490, partial [Acidimicrobiia bacterium]